MSVIHYMIGEKPLCKRNDQKTLALKEWDPESLDEITCPICQNDWMMVWGEQKLDKDEPGWRNPPEMPEIEVIPGWRMDEQGYMVVDPNAPPPPPVVMTEEMRVRYKTLVDWLNGMADGETDGL